MFVPDADADDRVTAHLGPVEDTDVLATYTHEPISTRDKGELARQAAYTPLEEASVCLARRALKLSRLCMQMMRAQDATQVSALSSSSTLKHTIPKNNPALTT